MPECDPFDAKERSLIDKIDDILHKNEGSKTPVQRLRAALRDSKPLNKSQEAERRAEIGRRTADMREEVLTAGTIDEQLQAMRNLRGGLPTEGLDPLEGPLGPESYEDLGVQLRTHYLRFKSRDLDLKTATKALEQLYLKGKVPTPKEIELMEEVFGSGTFASLPRKFNLWNEILAVINIPRVILANFDHSMIFRQDAITALNPRWAKETKDSIAASLKGLTDARVADEVELAMRQTDEWVNAVDDGVEFSRLRAQTFSAAEEPFIAASEMTWVGRQVRKIPGINMSERLAVVYLNQKRLKLYARLVAELGPDGTKAQRKQIGELVNVLTGRAKLPGQIDSLAPILNAVFFSARMNWSRGKAFSIAAGAVPDLIRGKKSTSLGLMMVRDFTAFIATGSTILGALHMSGLAEVELDPRSTDFGKAKFGPTRLDPWGGFLPMVRFVAQAATGQRKTSIGDIIPLDVQDSAWRFIRSKFSPQASFIADVIQGETVIGESVGLGDWERLVKENFIPLFIQDLIESYREMGADGIPLALPGLLGINVNSYTTSAVRVAEAIETGIREGLIEGEYERDGEAYIPLRFGELDHPGDKDRMVERFPELFSEEAFAERQEEIPEGTQRRVRGETIAGAREDKETGLGEVATEAGRSDASEQDARRFLSEQLQGHLKDYGAVLGRTFEQFQFEGDDDTFSSGGAVVKQYRDISEEHNARFTIADRDDRDAAWAAFEAEVARKFSSSDLRLLEQNRVINDSDIERAWHELNAAIGDSEYYDLPERSPTGGIAPIGGRLSPREQYRRDNPEVDGALWALGRVSRVMSPRNRSAATAAYTQLYELRIPVSDVSLGSTSGGIRGIGGIR